MKLTAVLLLAACLNVHAIGLTQKVSLSASNVPLEKVFSEIKSQTGYTFVYREVLLQKAKKVSVNISNASIEQVLDICLQGQPLTYTIVNKMVVLNEKVVTSKKEQAAPPAIAIQGKVTDTKGEPLAGATVSEKGTPNATRTKEDGTFAMSVASESSILVVSYTGYAPEEVSVGNQASINIQLVQEPKALNDVVVVGYGSMRKRDQTGAAVTVSSKDFNKGVFSAPDQLIQGKVAGVQMINNSGQPGGGTTVRIRGNSAITGSGQPLYVVDGVALDNRSARPGQGGGVGTSPESNPLNFLNPADIASMEILKDASATAIYGSRAAYGVVLITTKRGQAGALKIDASASAGVSTLMRKVDVLNADEYRAALTKYSLSQGDFGGSADAMKAITRKAITQNYTLSLSGGAGDNRYRVSFGYQDQEGIVRKTSFTKYTAGFNGNFKFLESKKLGLDVNLISSQNTENLPPITTDPAAVNGTLIGNALAWNPTRPLRNADGSLFVEKGSTTVNPLAMSEAYNDKSTVSTIMASVSPYYKLAKSLEYRMLVSLNYSAGIRRASTKSWINLQGIEADPGSNFPGGVAGYGSNELLTQQITHTLTFNQNIASKLTLNAVAGYEYMKFVNKGSTMFGRGFGNIGIDYTNALQTSLGNNRTISSFMDPTTELQSLFTRATLNFDNRYLITGTLRADGSTKFGEENKYGFFPAFSAAWNLNNEKFFSSEAINTLKLRAGWGKTGNQEFPAGASQQRYSLSTNGALTPANNKNASLKWQSDRQMNLGLDFGLLKNRITGTVDYFDKVTTDLLFPSIPLYPSSPGGNVVTWINLPGKIVNKGVELSLNGSIVNKADFTWTMGVNATFQRNNVTDMGSQVINTASLSGQGLSGVTLEVIKNDLPLFAMYTREYLGLDHNGFSQFTDEGFTYFYVGNPNPRTLLGVSTNFEYKKLSLGINFNGVIGQEIYNNTANAVIPITNLGTRNVAKELVSSDVKESLANPIAASSRYVEDGSYLKLTNATLAYRIPAIGKSLKNVNVFLTGQNLFVLTKFKGFDPEVNVNKSQNGVPSAGIEFTPYPTARTLNLGVNFSL